MKVIKPRDITETLRVLGDYGPEAKILAGGTDLVPGINLGNDRPKALVSIRQLKELDGIREEGDALVIGSSTTHAKISRSGLLREKAGALASASAKVGSPQIRNLGTVGGNLCWASPAADTAPALLSLGAEIVWRDGSGEHREPLASFFEGVNKTSLPAGVLVTGIAIPDAAKWTKSVFLKLGMRNAMTISVVNVAVSVALDAGNAVKDINISLGSVAPSPILAGKAGDHLKNKKPDQEMISAAARIAADETSPISDMRASAWYRHEMARVYTKNALSEALGF
ncbi:MAG: xanthine dehydrogenase family protein subunit M [Pseudomonadota bacterium]